VQGKQQPQLSLLPHTCYHSVLPERGETLAISAGQGLFLALLPLEQLAGGVTPSPEVNPISCKFSHWSCAYHFPSAKVSSVKPWIRLYVWNRLHIPDIPSPQGQWSAEPGSTARVTGSSCLTFQVPSYACSCTQQKAHWNKLHTCNKKSSWCFTQNCFPIMSTSLGPLGTELYQEVAVSSRLKSTCRCSFPSSVLLILQDSDYNFCVEYGKNWRWQKK
jgi:hypothetical protein